MKWWFGMLWKLMNMVMRRPRLLAVVLLFGVVACDSARNAYDTVTFDSRSPYGGTENPVKVKLGKPYSIAGTRYVPKHEPYYKENGMASWYGPGFDGRKTASGERFDEDELTAAHRTLPMPSIVRVTRRDTGKSIMVRVNDRGPFAHGRIIDLSKASAKAIGMLGVGVAPVTVEYLPQETLAYMQEQGLAIPEYMAADMGRIPLREKQGEDSYQSRRHTGEGRYLVRQDSGLRRSDATGGNSTRFRIQTASFTSRDNAQAHVVSLGRIAPADITPVREGTRTYYRVATRPVADYETAMVMLRATHALGYRDARIMVE